MWYDVLDSDEVENITHQKSIANDLPFCPASFQDGTQTLSAHLEGFSCSLQATVTSHVTAWVLCLIIADTYGA